MNLHSMYKWNYWNNCNLDDILMKMHPEQKCYILIFIIIERKQTAFLSPVDSAWNLLALGGHSATWGGQLRSGEKREREIMLTASEDHYEILTEVKSG